MSENHDASVRKPHNNHLQHLPSCCCSNHITVRNVATWIDVHLKTQILFRDINRITIYDKFFVCSDHLFFIILKLSIKPTKK